MFVTGSKCPDTISTPIISAVRGQWCPRMTRSTGPTGPRRRSGPQHRARLPYLGDVVAFAFAERACTCTGLEVLTYGAKRTRMNVSRQLVHRWLFHLASRPSCFFESGSNGRFARVFPWASDQLIFRVQASSHVFDSIMQLHVLQSFLFAMACGTLQQVSSQAKDTPLPVLLGGIENVANTATNFCEFPSSRLCFDSCFVWAGYNDESASPFSHKNIEFIINVSCGYLDMFGDSVQNEEN